MTGIDVSPRTVLEVGGAGLAVMAVIRPHGPGRSRTVDARASEHRLARQ